MLILHFVFLSLSKQLCLMLDGIIIILSLSDFLSSSFVRSYQHNENAGFFAIAFFHRSAFSRKILKNKRLERIFV